MDREDIKFFKRAFILVIVLGFSLGYLYLTKAQCYGRYERVPFESSGVTLYANLYYPAKDLSFQDKRPLLIYCHGIGSQRDFDLRIPIEFSKRGFYVAALDYQGHGESGGNINNIDPETKVPALAQDCSKLLDKIETMSFYSDVNSSQIGLIGHSLGGFVVLMNQALDSRFNFTVAWAPLVNFDPSEFGIFNAEIFNDYIPVNLLNETNTNSLLIIMHVNDEALNFTKNAIKAQELTNCSVIPISGFVLGSPHQLFLNSVLIDSINWFEGHFFKSETINGPIFITYLLNYFTIFLTLGLLFIIMLLSISYSAKVFKVGSVDLVEKQPIISAKLSKSKVIRQLIKIIVYSVIFVVNWEIFERLFGFIGIFFASLNISIIYTLIALRIYFKKLEREDKKFNLVELIKSQFKYKILIFAILCSGYFIGLYVLFSFFYPFAFMWPSNWLVDILLAEVVFPIYFSMEILYRKVLYPQLYFIKSERHKSFMIIALAFYVQINLISLTWSWSFFPSVMFTYLILLVVIIQNTLIYEKTQCFTTVILSSFNIIQFLFASIISNALGLGSALGLFVSQKFLI
jgi:dienelactone hydrolase